MNVIEIEKLKQLVSRTDMSGNQKVEWLTEFIDDRELQLQQKGYSEEEVLGILEDYDREFKLDTFAYTKPCKYTPTEWFKKK